MTEWKAGDKAMVEIAEDGIDGAMVMLVGGKDGTLYQCRREALRPLPRTGAEVMTLKSELIDAMATAIAWTPGVFDYPDGVMEDRQKLAHRVSIARNAAKNVLSAHSAFLTERGLKVVGREIDDPMRKAYWAGIDKSHAVSLLWNGMLAAAPNLFAEAEDAG